MTRSIAFLLVLLLTACGSASEPVSPGEGSPYATNGDSSSENPSDDDPSDGSVDDGDPGTADDADPTPMEDPDNPDPDPDPDPDPEPAPQGSEGCAMANTPADGEWTIEHDGRERSFLVHLPEGYDPSRPTPVVLNYHGRSMTASGQMALSEMNPVADANDFIAVYPEGTGALEQTWNAGFCCGSAQLTGVDDVGFTEAMLDELEASACIDTGRVYTIGISNGGFMSHRLGCELADRITAIGAVAGGLTMLDCSPARPVPMIHFHGDADRVVSYDGIAGQAGAEGTTETWRDANGCDGGGEVYFDEDDVTCERWTGCDEGAEVRLCTIDGGGHTWPGGSDQTFGVLGETTDTISASEHSWEFFSEHSM